MVITEIVTGVFIKNQVSVVLTWLYHSAKPTRSKWQNSPTHVHYFEHTDLLYVYSLAFAFFVPYASVLAAYFSR